MSIANVLILTAMFIGFVGDDVYAQETFSVQIDIDTRSSENTITIGKQSIVSVAIISTDDFNVATRIDLESLMLGGVLAELAWGGVGHPACSESDVNGDGKYDVVCKFDTGKLNLVPGEQMIELTGAAIGNEVAISGQDRINAIQE